MESDEVYLGGSAPFRRRFVKSKRPLKNVESYLPAVDCDLDEYAARLVPAPDVAHDTLEKASIERRHAEFQAEFEGRSSLLYLHSMLITVLRRNGSPPDALQLFLRIWKEQGQFLATELNVRWKVSAATTFADCGATLEQRALGMGLSILFDTIKLHESERRLSGQRGDTPFQTVSRAERSGIAFGMKPYALMVGDLDRNMIARLSLLAEQDDTIAYLAHALLSEIMTDQRTVFARLQRLKNAKSTD